MVQMDMTMQPPEPVAVKRFRMGPAAEGLPAHALVEVAALAELQAAHDTAEPKSSCEYNIVRLIDSWYHKGRVFAALEYADSDLASALVRLADTVNWCRRNPTARAGVMAECPFTGPVAGRILHGVFSGLQHMHRSGWMHRDVKPGNVLLMTVASATSTATTASADRTQQQQLLKEHSSACLADSSSPSSSAPAAVPPSFRLPKAVLCDLGMAARIMTGDADGSGADGSVEASAASSVIDAAAGAAAAASLPAPSDAAVQEAEGDDWWARPPAVHPTRYTHAAMHPQVVTPEFRPPELIYGAYTHGAAVDMWSAGCAVAMVVRALVMVAGWDHKTAAVEDGEREANGQPHSRKRGRDGDSSNSGGSKFLRRGSAPVGAGYRSLAFPADGDDDASESFGVGSGAGGRLLFGDDDGMPGIDHNASVGGVGTDAAAAAMGTKVKVGRSLFADDGDDEDGRGQGSTAASPPFATTSSSFHRCSKARFRGLFDAFSDENADNDGDADATLRRADDDYDHDGEDADAADADADALPAEPPFTSLFPGESPLAVLGSIVRMLGQPDTLVWPTATQLPSYFGLDKHGTCRYCCSGNAAGASSDPAAPESSSAGADSSWTIEMPWLHEATVRDSCVGADKAHPAYHLAAAHGLASWIGLLPGTSVASAATSWAVLASGLDLVVHLLSFDPGKRPTAAQAMCHPFIASLTEVAKADSVASDFARLACSLWGQRAAMHMRRGVRQT